MLVLIFCSETFYVATCRTGGVNGKVQLIRTRVRTPNQSVGTYTITNETTDNEAMRVIRKSNSDKDSL